jgi:hypothetical protein
MTTKIFQLIKIFFAATRGFTGLSGILHDAVLDKAGDIGREVISRPSGWRRWIPKAFLKS